MKVAVIGTGYVGLVAGACFADSGNDVICVDQDPSRIEALKKAHIPIYEPGLEELVQRALSFGRIQFTGSVDEAVRQSEVVFVAVGTPSGEGGAPDLRQFKTAVEQIASAMNLYKTGYRVIVNKSTVPLGTQRTVEEWVSAITDQPHDVASNPEFLKEGSAVDDFLNPDRVVIGTCSDRAYRVLARLYEPFVRQGNPILRMDPVSAELTKYASNAFLAARISFMNELARVSDAFGADIEAVRRGMASDHRIGQHFLYSGIGYGGSCFPKDIGALLAQSEKRGIDLEMVRSAERVNLSQTDYFLGLIEKSFPDGLSGKNFGVWGLAFKPNTDDMREAPSRVIISELVKRGAKVIAHDPVAMKEAAHCLEQDFKNNPDGLKQVSMVDNPMAALDGCDALVIVTEWKAFRSPDFEVVMQKLAHPIIFDGRNLYEPQAMQELGIEYHGIGRHN
jgi:UDPglucose 6-dehydrogenase